MYKSHYFFFSWTRLTIRSTRLPGQSSIHAAASFGYIGALAYRKYTHVAPEHVPLPCPYACCICCISTNYAWAFPRVRGLNTAAWRATSGLATENIQALYCLCANPVPGSCSDQRRTHWCPLLRNMWHFFPHILTLCYRQYTTLLSGPSAVTVITPCSCCSC